MADLEFPITPYTKLAEAVLVAHQRQDGSNCLCGRLKLGESWATHVAAILYHAGALKERPSG